MINTLKYIQQYIEPEIGVVIPVSGGEPISIINKRGVRYEVNTWNFVP